MFFYFLLSAPVHALIFCASEAWNKYRVLVKEAVASESAAALLGNDRLFSYTDEILRLHQVDLATYLEDVAEGELTEGAWLDILIANRKFPEHSDRCLYGLVVALYLKALEIFPHGMEYGEAAKKLLGERTRKNLDFMEDADWGVRSIDVVSLADVAGIFPGRRVFPWDVRAVFNTPTEAEIAGPVWPVIGNFSEMKIRNFEAWEVGVHASLTAEVLTMLGKHGNFRKFRRLVQKQYPKFVKNKCSEFFSQLESCPDSADEISDLFLHELPWSDEQSKPHPDLDGLKRKFQEILRKHGKFPDLFICTVPWMCLLFEDLEIPVLGYFGHPPLFMVAENMKAEVLSRLRKFAEISDRVAFAVTDPFLQMQYRYQLGLEFPYIRTSAEYIGFSTDVKFPRDVLVWDRPYDMALFAAIQEVIDQRGNFGTSDTDEKWARVQTTADDDDIFMRQATDGKWRLLGRHALTERRYENLRNFQAIVIYPYDMDLVTFYEFYRMGVPIFMPRSAEKYLFKQGHMNYDMGIRLDEPASHEFSDSSRWRLEGLSPFNETNAIVAMEQLKYADYFRFPGIQFFDNISDLLDKLNTVDFDRIRETMEKFWQAERTSCASKWRAELNRIL